MYSEYVKSDLDKLVKDDYGIQIGVSDFNKLVSETEIAELNLENTEEIRAKVVKEEDYYYLVGDEFKLRIDPSSFDYERTNTLSDFVVEQLNNISEDLDDNLLTDAENDINDIENETETRIKINSDIANLEEEEEKEMADINDNNELNEEITNEKAGVEIPATDAPVEESVGVESLAEKQERLSFLAASAIHSDWCDGEIKAFFGRAVEALGAQSPEALNVEQCLSAACIKNGKERNKMEFDDSRQAEILEAIKDNDLEKFKNLIADGAVTVRRFTGRNLTDAEKEKAGDKNYVNGEENILRPFGELSYASQEENLTAAIDAARIYVELCQAGVSDEQMQESSEIRNNIGRGIHLDWCRRNPEGDPELLVKYDDLKDEWMKNQDLVVFDAVRKIAKENPDMFTFEAVPGMQMVDYSQKEEEFFAAKKPYGV